MNRPSLPCPIPRCALEWFLALQAAVAGSSIWLSGDPRLGQYDISMPFMNISMSSLRWGIALWFIAALQAVALHLWPIGPQRAAAGLACFAWLAFSASSYQGGMIAFAFTQAILTALGQLYVCAMLQGARWTG